MEKIRVLRIINRFNIGGPTYNATFLTSFLDERYETLLVGGLPDKGESDSLYILDKYGVKPLLIEEMVREPNFKSDREAYIRLKKIIREFKPEIVHTHASKAGALGRKAAFACKVPIVIHTFHGHVFHSYFGKTKTLIFKTIERRLAKKTSAIIAISEQQGKELALDHKICSESKVRVINLGFDLDQFHDKRLSERARMRKIMNLEDDHVAIAIVGRLAPIKNHVMFFQVIRKVLEATTKRVKVFVVGDGAERPVIEELTRQINSDYGVIVSLTSWVRDIAEFNAAMDIICMTSLNEGTPVSLIEAQAGNIPVISTDVGGVRDVVDEGRTAFVVPSNDVETFSEKLILLIEDEKKRLEMSQNGWNFVKDKFHYRTLVGNMERLYDELLNDQNG